MSAPWTAHYDSGVPGSLAPYPARTLVDYVRESGAELPDAPALFFKGTRISNAELDRLSDRFAAGLVSAGVRRGDRVALLLPNCPQFIIAELGAWKAGATVLPLNPLYTASELIEPLRSTGVADRRHAHAVLPEAEGDSAGDLDPAGDRDEHQGVPAAPPSAAVHCVQGKKGRPPDCARSRRRLVSAVSESSCRCASACAARPGRSCDHADERRHDRNAKGRRRPASMSCGGGASVEDVAATSGRRAPTTSRSWRFRSFTCTRRSAFRVMRSPVAFRWRSCPTRAISTTC